MKVEIKQMMGCKEEQNLEKGIEEQRGGGDGGGIRESAASSHEAEGATRRRARSLLELTQQLSGDGLSLCHKF